MAVFPPSDDHPTAAPAGLVLTTPGPWLRLDLDPQTRSASLAKLVGERLGDDAALLDERRELTAALRAFARDAVRSGAIYAAVMLDLLDDVPVQASLIASYAATPPATTEGADPLDGLVRALAGDADSAEVDRIALRLGDGCRLVTMCEAPYGDGTRTPTLVAQYVVSVPGSRQALLLSFSSPNIAHREAMLGLFDAIAQGARWAPS